MSRRPRPANPFRYSRLPWGDPPRGADVCPLPAQHRQTYKQRRSAALAEWRALAAQDNAHLVENLTSGERFAL